MKKLIVVLATVAMAGLTHAATCTWGSGALKTAASKDGGWSGTTVNSAGALVTMSIYLIDETTYNGLSGKSQQDLYDTYNTKTADLTGQNKNPSTGALIGAITINQDPAAASVQYAVAIATYTDATYGDMYIANLAKTTYNAGTQKESATGLMTGISSWSTASSDVPEPTSGLLLLVGGAMLALRRKQK